MESVLAIGLGIGLASIAGIRAYMPLLILGVAAGPLQLFVFPEPLNLLQTPVAMSVLLGLAIAESALDKVSSTERIVNLVHIPVRVVAGAGVLSALVGIEAIPEIVAGGVIAGAVAVLKYLLRPPVRVQTSGVSSRFLSVMEDMVSVIGGFIAVIVPLLPVLFAVFLLYVYYRIRRRRGRKYQGLRILND